MDSALPEHPSSKCNRNVCLYDANIFLELFMSSRIRHAEKKIGAAGLTLKKHARTRDIFYFLPQRTSISSVWKFQVWTHVYERERYESINAGSPDISVGQGAIREGGEGRGVSRACAK